MAMEYPATWSSLQHPWWRFELLAHLQELAAPDPRPLWQEGRRRGLISGIDQVFHFLFDDHDFDAGEIGYTLFDADEAEAIGATKRALQALLAELGDVQDDEYVSHHRWPQVTVAAAAAYNLLAPR